MPPIVLSMTTVPARRGTLGPTLYSLKRQTLAHDLRIYAGPCCDVPQNLWVPYRDHGPVTKIAAVLDAVVPEDALVVTVDDDIIYEPTWLETLVAAAARHAGAVGFSGWSADRFRAGEHEYRWHKPGETCDVLEGWCGVAYRRAWFDPSILEPPEPFRLVDDVWISSYLARKGIERRVIGWPLAAPKQDPLPGLHDRVDFKAMNARAALLGFP